MSKNYIMFVNNNVVWNIPGAAFVHGRDGVSI
jgi:hypothetical protein